jgi:hypothetical protein
MHAVPPAFLQRLRHQRGGWMLLLAALLVKLAASTVCLLDSPRAAWAAPDTRVPAALVVAQAASDDASNDNACLLGEGAGCHCACAHAAALPSTPAVVTAMIALPIAMSHLPRVATTLASGSLLRPPIA